MGGCCSPGLVGDGVRYEVSLRGAEDGEPEAVGGKKGGGGAGLVRQSLLFAARVSSHSFATLSPCPSQASSAIHALDASDAPLHWARPRTGGTGPGGRRGHTLSLVAFGQQNALLSFGGISSRRDKPDRAFFTKEHDPYRNDNADNSESDAQVECRNTLTSSASYLLNVDEKQWSPLKLLGNSSNADIPGPRCDHTAVVWKDGLYVFGAQTRHCDSLYRLNFSTGTWKLLSCTGSKPPPTAGHTVVVYDDIAWLFGGEAGTMRGYVTNQFYACDLEEQEWAPVSCADNTSMIQPRRDHSAVVHDHMMWVYGGVGESGGAVEFVVFDFRDMEWSRVKAFTGSPPCRSKHACGVWENYMFVYGGVIRGEVVQDLVVFDCEGRIWWDISGPPVKKGISSIHSTRCVQGSTDALLAKRNAPNAPPAAEGAAACFVGDTWYVQGGGDAAQNYKALHCLPVRGFKDWAAAKTPRCLAEISPYASERPLGNRFPDSEGRCGIAVTPLPPPSKEGTTNDSSSCSSSATSPKALKAGEILRGPGGLPSIADISVVETRSTSSDIRTPVDASPVPSPGRAIPATDFDDALSVGSSSTNNSRSPRQQQQRPGRKNVSKIRKTRPASKLASPMGVTPPVSIFHRATTRGPAALTSTSAPNLHGGSI
ncbi:Ras guanine nucleotide exchange factor F [Diplonema papillatum]|nr:Ras guanine nucleotide exchange factor F [Diplonema papillatum]